MAPILSGDVEHFQKNVMNNPFRDVSEDVEKLVVGDFSQDVVNSAEAINKVLNPIVNNENEEE